MPKRCRITYDPAQISYAQAARKSISRVAHDPTAGEPPGARRRPELSLRDLPAIARSRHASPRRSSHDLNAAHVYKAPIATKDRAAAASIRPKPITRTSREKHPYLPLHRRQRSAEGRRAEAEIPGALQGLSSAKRLRFHALFRRGRQGRPSPYMRALPSARELGDLDDADDQSVRRRQAARGVRRVRHLGCRQCGELRRAGPARAAAPRPGSGRHHHLRRQAFPFAPGDGPCRRQFRPRRRHAPPRRPRRRSAMSAIRRPARPRCATSSRCSPNWPRAASRSRTTAISPTR